MPGPGACGKNVLFFAPRSIHFVAGIAASLASVSWQPAINSVGASGAIFGIFGALMAAQLHNGGSIPKNVLRPLRYTSSLYIALTLFAGFSKTGVDNAAHIGGIAAGFLTGLAVCRPITGRRSSTGEFSRRLAQGVSLAACVLAGGAWSAKVESTRLTGQGLFAQTLHWYAPRENANLSLWHGSRHLATTLHWSDETYANWLDREIVPFWAEADRRFQRIELAKTSPSYSHLESFQELASGRLHAFGLIVSGLRRRDEEMTSAGADEIKEGDKLIHEKASAVTRSIGNFSAARTTTGRGAIRECPRKREPTPCAAVPCWLHRCDAASRGVNSSGAEIIAAILQAANQSEANACAANRSAGLGGQYRRWVRAIRLRGLATPFPVWDS